MDKLEPRQIRLWEKMICLLESLLCGKLLLGHVVDELVLTLRAGEYKDEGLIKEWYSYWGSLEIIYAMYGDISTTDEQLKQKVKEMHSFLVQKRQSWGNLL